MGAIQDAIAAAEAARQQAEYDAYLRQLEAQRVYEQQVADALARQSNRRWQ